MESKVCSLCGIEKSINNFSVHKRDGVIARCKDCSRESDRARGATPERKQSKHTYYQARYDEFGRDWQKKYDLKHKYGITKEDYRRMYEFQNGNCAICGNHKDVLDIDHDHTTGEVRGLLCPSCNRGVGLLKDKSSVLENAAKYLKKFFK